MNTETVDSTGVIREAYRIEGITPDQCRSILLAWALKLPGDADQMAAIQLLLDEYGTPGHPMTELLTEALSAPVQTGRRGGWRGRQR